ncbi:hypothetical protein Tco_1318292 [Tanacetum coccineum]
MFIDDFTRATVIHVCPVNLSSGYLGLYDDWVRGIVEAWNRGECDFPNLANGLFLDFLFEYLKPLLFLSLFLSQDGKVALTSRLLRSGVSVPGTD